MAKLTQSIQTHNYGDQMDNKKFLKSVLAIVEKQQAALKKMAATKVAQMPEQEGLAGAVAPTLRTADVILQHLPANVKPWVERLEVNEATDQVKVKFKPGATQTVVDTLQKAVDALVSNNTIARGRPLTVTPV